MPDVPVPLLLPSDLVRFMNEVVAGSPINCLDQAPTFLSLMVGVNLLTDRQHQGVNFLLPYCACCRR